MIHPKAALLAATAAMVSCGGSSATVLVDGDAGNADANGGDVDGATRSDASVPLIGCNNPFGDDDQIIDFHLRTTRQAWYDVARDVLEPNGTCNQYPYHQMEFRCGDSEPWITIGVRRKRGDHFGLDNPDKPFLKLDFNQVVPGQGWPAHMGKDGYRKLTLNNGQEGRPGSVIPLLLSEELAWRLIREEIPEASKSTYTKLYVHFTDDNQVEYHGLYSAIEDINRGALRRRGMIASGLLTKDTGSGCDGPVFDDGAPNQSSDRFAAWQALSPSNFAGTWAAETDKAMHVDHLFTQQAMRDIMVNFANPMGLHGENYLTWDAAANNRMYLPWDLDQAFRGPGWPTDETVVGCLNQLAQNTRCQPELLPRYQDIVCNLINGTMSSDNILAESQAIDDLLRLLIPEERDALWSNRQDPLTTNSDAVRTYQEQLQHLITWVPQRIAAVRAELENAGKSCPAP